MHPFFRYPATETPELPPYLRLYARIEQISEEDRIASDGEFGQVSFEAIDADALGPVALSWPVAWWDCPRLTWETPLYLLDVVLPLRKILEYDQGKTEYLNTWFEIRLARGEPGTPVDLYSALFSEPDTAYRLQRSPDTLPRGKSWFLNRVFNLPSFLDTSETNLQRILSRLNPVNHFIAFDVGQGSAIALCKSDHKPQMFFDVGCGYKRNANTRPSPIRFCQCDDPVVVLSHWDGDHWCGAFQDTNLLSRDWVVPRQALGPVNSTFASSILNRGGTLSVVPSGLGPIKWIKQGQEFTLQRCNGTDRNASGIALLASDQNAKRSWLFTGDAGYHRLPFPLPSDLSAVAVPHHGAEMGFTSNRSIPAPVSSGYKRLVYSFGPGNRHGKHNVSHPREATADEHHQKNWNHGTWPLPPVADRTAGGDVLATAIHPSTHLGGAAIGWDTAPTPGNCSTCLPGMPVTQN